MNNPFPFSDDHKRYHTWNYYLRRRFGCKVCKIPLNAGFTCPNRDGTKGRGGCTFCSASGSGDFAGRPEDPLPTQFYQVRDRMRMKWPDAKYLVYFQAFTNTYAPLEVLKMAYEQVLGLERVVGLCIATRADCIEEGAADYLAELSKRTFLTVELGLQTIWDETGKRVNRCHTYEDFLQSYERLTTRGIPVCVHIINGLPGETREMMTETARQLARLDPFSVKIHLLHVLRGTAIARELEDGAFQLMTREEYVSTVCDQMEQLPPETVVQRVTGDGGRDALIGPQWSLKKFCVMNEIDKELLRRGSHQGIFYEGRNAGC